MKLVFVYNADAGFVNGMIDSIHKTVSPDTYVCALCQLTHGLFNMDKSWRAYLQSLPMESVFFHRQDFKAAYPQASYSLPAILLESDGVLRPLISSEQLRSLKDVNELIGLLDSALKGVRQSI